MEAEKFLIKTVLTSSDETIEIKNPYTQKIVKKVYKSSKEHINQSLNYLSSVFPKYKTTSTYTKSELLSKISKKVSDRKEELAQLITLETGKPIKFSRIEVDRAVLTFQLGSEETKRIEGETLSLDLLKGSEGKKGIVRRFPIGIILAITPWNFPINLVAHKISPALASGNVVLLKPASASLCCGIELGKIIKEASEELSLDFCPVNVVTSSGGDIEEFLGDDRIKLISFTGSPLIGWGLKKHTYMQKLSLELGGNAGVIVDETADIKTAAEKIAVGGFAQAGQSCISVQRVFVHKNIYEEFKKIVLEETAKIKYGNPFEEETMAGPMINESEAKRVEKWIEEAKETNAKVLTGGERDVAVMQPTIIEDANKNLNVNSKEVFAPLITIKEFDSFKSAIEEVNDSDLGLQAGVFTNNFTNAMYAYEHIETGGVIINDVSAYRMDSMPYGGIKQSGNAREGVKYAIEEMTERKVMVY
jgi:acyl-CoA reductase-like NAD-dependent aldehyde dehydrogenase